MLADKITRVGQLEDRDQGTGCALVPLFHDRRFEGTAGISLGEICARINN